MQDYLHFPLKKSEKLILHVTKLRISAHSLHIETGRYSRPCVPTEKRTCHTCRLFIENEIHFVLYCPKYDQYRCNYNDIFNVNTYTSDNPIRKIVNPTNISTTRRICCFLKKCFDIRKESQK